MSTTTESGPQYVKPVIDLNLATQANRIVRVLNKLISRARFAGTLKELVKDDAHLLKDILDTNSHFFVLQTCDKYHYDVLGRITSLIDSFDVSEMTVSQKSSETSKSSEDSVSSLSTSSTPTKKFERKGKDRFDEALSKVVYLLEENREVQKIAKSLENEISPQMRFFLKCLTEFRNRMETRLHETAAQFKAKEKYLKEIFEKNEKIKKEIEKLEDELMITKTDTNICLIGKNILIHRYQAKIEKIQQNSQELAEKRVKESEKIMVNDWKTSMIEQERLKGELEQAAEKFENLRKEHLFTEKLSRAKRSKVENQVLGWIQKFDQDIGEKQAEEEEIQALLDQEIKEVNEIQSKLDEQEEEFDELMQEKTKYEEEVLERRLYQFIVNRSARRIQRTFRLYKARKMAKKLAKKGKKGKKKGK